MKRIIGIDPAWGITIVRFSTGLIFVVHGMQKFVTGLGGVTAFFAKIGIPAPGVMGHSSRSWRSLVVSCSSSASPRVG